MLRSPVDGQGSPAALSIAALNSEFVKANPATFAIVGVSAALIGGATFIYHSIKAKEEAAFRNKANAVNELHRAYLQHIHISNGSLIPGFPQPFTIKRDTDGRFGPVEMMHLTDDQINASGSHDPDVDVNLKKYRELIKDACKQLRAYYLERDDRDDITAGVVSYLLTILNSHCLNFAGYEFDLAYLSAIAAFINGFASKDHDNNSPEYTRLTPVYATLHHAIDALKEHQNIISLKSIAGDIDSHSKRGSEALIRFFVQLTSPEDHWKFIDNATFTNMSEGFLRKSFAHGEILGLIPTWDKEIKIPDSYFFEWLKFIFRYYEEGLTDTTDMKLEEILPPNEHFKLPDLSTSNDRTQRESDRKSIDSIRELYKLCDNFLTRKPDPNSETGFIPVVTDAEVIERAKVLGSMATLIHYLISLQYISSYLLKSLKQIGEIRFKNPKHYTQVFKVFEQICQQAIKATESAKKQIEDLQKSNQHRMRLANQNNLPINLLESLTSIHVNLSEAFGKAQVYCKKAAQNKNSPESEYETVDQALFLVVARLGKTYGIPIENIRSSTDGVHPINNHWEKAVEHTLNTPPVSPRSLTTPVTTSPTYWERNKNLLQWIILGTSLTCLLASFVISIASGGTLSPLASFLGLLGVKIGVTGASLYGLDALFGLLSGMLLGCAADGVMLANNALQSNKEAKTSEALVSYRLNPQDSTPVKAAVIPPSTEPSKAEKPIEPKENDSKKSKTTHHAKHPRTHHARQFKINTNNTPSVVDTTTKIVANIENLKLNA